MSPRPIVNLTDIKQAIEDNSGYPFELQIAQRVERYHNYGYYVEPNYSFEDHDTGQARELDFHAVSAVPISTRKSQYCYTVILGSCKANKQPYVFFTRRSPLAGITFLLSDVPISGCPLEIVTENGEKESLDWYLQLNNFLHIAKHDKVSSQFTSLALKNSKYEIQNENISNGIITPLFKAMSREIERHNLDCVPTRDKTLPEYHIYYPLLVLKGPLFEYYVPNKGPAQLRKAKHILVIRRYESKAVKCSFAIDVIHESYLNSYLKLVGNEVDTFIKRIKRHSVEIDRSISQLTATKNRTPKQFRKLK